MKLNRSLLNLVIEPVIVLTLLNGCGGVAGELPAAPPAASTAAGLATEPVSGAIASPAVPGAAVQSSEPAAASVPHDPAPGLPEQCRVAGHQTFTDVKAGYCFTYPGRFMRGELAPDQPAVFGPARDASADPIRAILTVEVKPVPAGSILKRVVDDFAAEFPDLPWEVTRRPATLGGEPAEVLEVVPGRYGSRNVLVLHAGKFYNLYFMPSTRDFPQAQADVEELFRSVMASFAFLMPE